ncbi:MAG TPA: TRAP transporter substrate-binding protein [Pseudolabrys sp.]|nr:TRAP transporter substrate-binding protein [Pseudolabrys sp.]
MSLRGAARLCRFVPADFWLLVLACMAALGSTLVVHAREFRSADIQEEDHPAVQAVRHMGRAVTERTGGRHTVEVFHSGQLGDEGNTIQQTLTGVIDINRINVVEIGKIVPELNVLALPFLFRSADHLQKVVYGPIGEEILATIEPHGFVGLAFYDAGARSIYTTSRAVRTLGDLEGLQLRVLKSELMERMIKALGAQPINLPFRQLLTALSTRLIDGAENNWPSFIRTGHYKVAPFYTLTEHTRGPSVLVMSRRAWDGLSPEDRIIVRDAARASATYMKTAWQALEDQSQKQAVEGGVRIISEIDRRPFEAATKSLRDEARTDPKLAWLMARIESAQ